MKDLHVATSMEALDGLAKIPNLRDKHALKVAESANSVLQKAEKEFLDGDEELAYIFYIKYFKVLDVLKKAKDYEGNKLIVRNMVGGNEKLGRIMDRLEIIKGSLLERYASKSKSINDVPSTASQMVSNETNGRNETAIVPSPKFIGCEELYMQMRSANIAILLIDCRHRNHYAESRIEFKNIINIPSEIIQKGLSAYKLTEKIDEKCRRLFECRDQMDLVVLIDWDETKNTDSSKPIWILRSILTSWDPDTKYRSKPKVLEGGYENFLIRYPMHTTNPKFKMPSQDSSRMSLDDIEYPSFEQIKMKEQSIDGGFTVPRIDRSNKATAQQKFMDTRKPTSTVELVKEKEMRMDQVIRKEKEVLSIGTELSNILNVDVTNDPDKKKEWFNKQTELEYKLVQKENELNDTMMELESVEPSGFENKLETLQIDARKQPDMSEMLARIEAKQIEHSQMEKRRIENAQIIEERRRPYREQQKRHLEIEEEEQIRPKLPTIDRSVKPTAVQKPQQQIQRSFSPVHGSYGAVGATGLKNLGNTCYMNSIIQCLLNLEPLCEYLKRGLYQHDLNEKSKTQGMITEELAVVCSEVWSGRFKSIAPRSLRYVIGQYQKMFSGYDQQDSHEFLTILLDMLHLELQIAMDQDPDEKLSVPEKAWREFVKNKESIIQALFFGQIRSTLKCKACTMESPTYEGFSNLSLELPNDNQQCELYDCLDLYFNGEFIDGWTCPRCKQRREAVKKLDISKLPQILVIHLKRFHVNLHSSLNTYQKKQNYVRFPITDFNISDYITLSLKSRNESMSYDLCAVSNHYGTMERGHYTAFCKNYKTKCWYKFDDNYVTQIPSNEVNSSAAYILFYSRN